MLKRILFISILTVFSLSMLNAQTTKGKFMIGASSSFGFSNSNSDLMSLGYTTTKVDGSSDSDKTLSLNLTPRVGLFVVENLAIGLDVNLAISRTKFEYLNEESKSISTLFCAGPYVRYYIPTQKVIPFFELACSYGVVKSNDSATNMSSDSKTGILNFSGGVGLAAPLGERVTFDAMLAYSSLRIKDETNSFSSSETIVINHFGIKVGFVIFFGGN